MAWASSNSLYAMNWDPSGEQGQGQESQIYESNFLQDLSLDSIYTDGVLHNDHTRRSRFNPSTACLLPQMSPYMTPQPFQNLQAIHDNLNYLEATTISGHELPKSSQPASVPSADAFSTSTINNTPHWKGGPDTDRVRKT